MLTSFHLMSFILLHLFDLAKISHHLLSGSRLLKWRIDWQMGWFVYHFQSLYMPWHITSNQAYFSWWRHQMETFSASLDLCNSPATGEIPSQKLVTRSFAVFFDLRLNKWLSKQSRRRWLETPLYSLWRHSNGLRYIIQFSFCNPRHMYSVYSTRHRYFQIHFDWINYSQYVISGRIVLLLCVIVYVHNC